MELRSVSPPVKSPGRSSGLVIASLDPRLARRTGLAPGDRIVRVNGEPAEDELDYRFHAAEERVVLEVEGVGACPRRLVSLSRRQAGCIAFSPMRTRRCRNRCVFCFVDQLPCGLRKSLYVKDEDYRLSFLYGNYVTLSSIRDAELERILRIRMSPLYVSVHATDVEVRNRLLGRKQGRDVLEDLRRLTLGGISVHAQVVLCPGINDGKILDETVSDLVRLGPGLASIAVVPVGLTRFRRSNGLPHLRSVGRGDAARIVSQIEWLKEKWKAFREGPFLFLADEFYRKADLEFPRIEAYGDLPQIGNGVGMIPLFRAQVEESRRRRRARTAAWPAGSGSFVVVTGELAYPHVQAYVRWLETAAGVRIRLVPVRNRALGAQVNVTGLLMGTDVRKQLRGRVDCLDTILLPDVMLDCGNERFLDDVSLGDLERDLGAPVSSFRPDPESFERILEACAPSGRGKRKKTDPMVD